MGAEANEETKQCVFPEQKSLTSQWVLLHLEQAVLEQQMAALQHHPAFLGAPSQQGDGIPAKTLSPGPFKRLRWMQDALAKQRKFGTPIHHALDEFELIHLAFDDAIILDTMPSFV